MGRYGSHVEQTYRNAFGLKKSKSIDIKIQKNWFILVHFTKIPLFILFVAYRAASILALASSTSELLMELR